MNFDFKGFDYFIENVKNNENFRIILKTNFETV